VNTTAYVSDWRGFTKALRDGKMHIVNDGHITIEEPVDLSINAPGSFYTFTGGGGWTSGVFYRGFDGSEPMFKAPRYGTEDGKERHWQMRFSGLLFEPMADRYPDAGPSLDFEMLQLSRFNDLYFGRHPGHPFVFGRDNCNACHFNDLFVMQSAKPGLLLEASDFHWTGGAIEQHSISYGTGLVIRGPSRDKPNTYPGPGLISDVHMEMSALEVHGVDDLIFRRGYRYWAPARFTDCDKPKIESAGGLWRYSETTVDGVEIPLLVEPV
jgi:hypothetical protein